MTKAPAQTLQTDLLFCLLFRSWGVSWTRRAVLKNVKKRREKVRFRGKEQYVRLGNIITLPCMLDSSVFDEESTG